jgi:ribA/ribD-fused uncharacterized protein
MIHLLEYKRAIEENQHTYKPEKCSVFFSHKESWFELSNFALGYPISFKEIPHIFKTSEHLYQALKFSDYPSLQLEICKAATPKDAKVIANRNQHNAHKLWWLYKIRAMEWVITQKHLCNFEKFSVVLLSTGDKPIVEKSNKDDFWGAKPQPDGTLKGANVLGGILEIQRHKVRNCPLQNASVFKALTTFVSALNHFSLFDRPIYELNASGV